MGKANIKESLNRAVAKVDWRSLCPKATVKHLPLIASDHALQNFHNTGNPQFLLVARIKQVKINLKWWNMNVFGLIQKRLSSLRSEIEQIQRLDSNEVTHSKEQSLQWEYNEWLQREKALWRQKSKVTWLSTPDLNTKFFHVTTTVRRRRNQICFLKSNSRS